MAVAGAFEGARLAFRIEKARRRIAGDNSTDVGHGTFAAAAASLKARTSAGGTAQRIS